MSELLIDSAIDESEANSPIWLTHQESKDEVVYLSRMRKVTIHSKLVTEAINDMKMKLGSKVMLRQSEKTKVHFEPQVKTSSLQIWTTERQAS